MAAQPATPPQSAPEMSTRELLTTLVREIRQQNDREQGGGLSAEKRAELTTPPEPKKWRLVPWRSPDTGATAMAHVVESKTFKHGRVTGLHGYTHPREAYISKREDGTGEGLVPYGMDIWRDGPVDLPEDREPATGVFNVNFLHWRWQNFFQSDLKAQIGKELKSHACQNPEDLAGVRWQDGRVGSIHE
jgi:hypothetical protein